MFKNKLEACFREPKFIKSRIEFFQKLTLTCENSDDCLQTIMSDTHYNKLDFVPYFDTVSNK